MRRKFKKNKFYNIRRKYRNSNYKGLSWISLLLAVVAGSMVVGGITYMPTSARAPITNKSVTIPDPNCKGDNIHLCTFVIATITPIKKPTDKPNNNGNPKDNDKDKEKDKEKDKGNGPTPTPNNNGGGGDDGGGGRGGNPL